MMVPSPYQLLPEWSKQSAVMLTWPHQATIWAETLAVANQVFARIAYEIALREKVLITCFDTDHEHIVRQALKQAGADCSRIHFYHAPSNDVWVRDHGPITVMHQHAPCLLDFRFNGWGNKYDSAEDDALCERLAQHHAFGQTPYIAIDMVLEGGAIEVDGNGTLLTTSSCLLAKTRNPHLSQAQISEHLKHYFGVQQILWLDQGHLEGDDTDGHIDTLARFINPNTICYVCCDDPNDVHYDSLKKMEAKLKAYRNVQGEAYQLIALPVPQAKYADYDGRRLPATYANFLIINGAVLVPTYEDPADEVAFEIMRAAMPDRDIITIPSLPLIQWYGSIHCMTMQLPSGVIS